MLKYIAKSCSLDYIITINNINIDVDFDHIQSYIVVVAVVDYKNQLLLLLGER